MKCMATWENGYGSGMDALISLMCCLTEPKPTRDYLSGLTLENNSGNTLKKPNPTSPISRC